MAKTVAEQFVETLAAAGVKRIRARCSLYGGAKINIKEDFAP